METKTSKPAIFDLEATGLNISKTEIVGIAIVKINPDGTEEHFSLKLVIPKWSLGRGFTEYLGITNGISGFTDVWDYRAAIGSIHRWGWSGRITPIDLIFRCWQKSCLELEITFDVSGRKFIDVQNIFHKNGAAEHSSLPVLLPERGWTYTQCNAYRYTATQKEVLKAQLEKYEGAGAFCGLSVWFSKASTMNIVDFAGRLGSQWQKWGGIQFWKA